MARLGVVITLAAAGLLATSTPLSGRAGSPGVPAGSERSAAAERPAGTLLFVVGSNRLSAIDVASGRRTVRRVAVARCGPEVYVSGDRVVFAGVGGGGRTTVFSAPVSLDRAPKRLGRAHAFVPSATAGRVWLAGVDCSRRAMVGVRELTVDGRITFASRRRLPRGWLMAAVEGGLVLRRGRTVVVWDPRTGGIGRRLPLQDVSDTHESLLVGCAARSACRELTIVDAETGRTVVARRGHPYRLDAGAQFSPDGSLVAVPAEAGRRWSVALVDTRDGTTRIVPGSRTGGAYPTLSWAPSSGWLFFRAGGARVKAYRPGTPRAVALPFRPPRASAPLAG
jgi:hypothetical protein